MSARGPGPLKHPRLYEHLATHIAEFIEAQGLSPGDRLPPERQLAADLGVSRATLGRALAALEVQGKVEVKHGIGALVREEGAGDGFEDRVAQHDRDQVAMTREAVLAGIARAAASHPHKSMRIAMLGDDGTVPPFGELWRCVRRLAGGGLLCELDDVLAARCPDPDESPALRTALDALAVAVVRGWPEDAATACIGMLVIRPSREEPPEIDPASVTT
ncbi:MAG TPA: GntR family transcriptional regulator [Nocardioidaceae bacterium]|nr:GntR family transcriptional regulator [Nocardioidaceae bacterium]